MIANTEINLATTSLIDTLQRKLTEFPFLDLENEIMQESEYVAVKELCQFLFAKYEET